MKFVVLILDIFFLPLLFFSALPLKLYRRIGASRLSFSTRMLKSIGVFPIRDHYYEPLFNDKVLEVSLDKARILPGIDFEVDKQLELLRRFDFGIEFGRFLQTQESQTGPQFFQINNPMLGPTDSEFLFNFIRYIKPKRVIEIGCGSSTKIIQHASKINERETNAKCKHICIEPFEQPWLDSFPDISLMREKVECIDKAVFSTLEDGDFLFIDSSHIIRPQGDVLCEYLDILPTLKSGVYVHVHDVFSPYDYPEKWIKESVLFWNEQYILEALLSTSSKFEVVAALNLLFQKYRSDLAEALPISNLSRVPGSFYLRTAN